MSRGLLASYLSSGLEGSQPLYGAFPDTFGGQGTSSNTLSVRAEQAHITEETGLEVSRYSSPPGRRIAGAQLAVL